MRPPPPPPAQDASPAGGATPPPRPPSAREGWYGALIGRGWWIVLLVALAAAVALGRHAPDLGVEAGTSVLLNEGDPDLAYYERTRAQWGYDEYAIVCVSGRDWTSAEGAALLREMAAELARAPGAARVLSLLDLPLLRQAPGAAIDLRRIVTLADPAVDHARARDELSQHTLAQGNLLSNDLRSTSLLVYLDVPADLRRLDLLRAGPEDGAPPTAEEQAERARLEAGMPAAVAEQTRRRTELVAAVRRFAEAWGARLGEPVRLSGICVINVNVVEHLRHDLRVFGLAALGFFALTFLVIYRRLRFMLLPLLTSLLPVVLIVGAMSALGMKVTIITSSLPLLLFVLLLPYTVYFVEGYLERQRLDPGESALASTVRAARAIFWPCLLSCTTTMAGFAALRTSQTRPVREFGVMLAAGMAIGLVVVFLTLPALSRPLRPLRLHGPPSPPRLRGVVRLLAGLTLRRPGAVVLGAVALLAVSAAGAARLDAQSKFTGYFRTSSEVYQGLEYVDVHMGGTTPLEVHVRGPAPGWFLTPPGLEALRAVGAYFEGVPETGNVRSLVTLVDELRKKVPGVVPLLPALAKHPRVREVMREFVDDDHDLACVLVRMRETAPTLDRARILAGLRGHLASRPELAPATTRVTGVFLLYENMLATLLSTQRESFLWVIAAILAMVLLLFREVLTSLLVVGTQVLPTFVTLGVMGWAGIPLDLVTVMIASISMGVGIDASIQYAWRHRHERALGDDPAEALRRTHASVGRAIWIATTVIVCGFLVLVLSDFTPSVWLGLLNAVAMLVSQLSALTVLPALLLLRDRRRAARLSAAPPV